MNDRLHELHAPTTNNVNKWQDKHEDDTLISDTVTTVSFVSDDDSLFPDPSSVTKTKHSTRNKRAKKKILKQLRSTKKLLKSVRNHKKNNSKKRKVLPTIDEQDPTTLERSRLMNTFYKNIQDLQDDIKVIPKARLQVEQNMEQVLMLGLSSRQEQDIDNQVCQLMTETGTAISKIQGQLVSLQDETKELSSSLSKHNALNATDLRIRQTLVTALMHKWTEELRLYQAAQEDYKCKSQEKIRRQLSYVLPADMTTKEEKKAAVDQMLAKGDRDELYQSVVLQHRGVNLSIGCLHTCVADKHHAIQQIQTQMNQVLQMMLELQWLVVEQGEVLDRIDFHVQGAVDYVREGNDEIVDSIQLEKKIRQKKLKPLVIAGVATAVLVIILL